MPAAEALWVVHFLRLNPSTVLSTGCQPNGFSWATFTPLLITTCTQRTALALGRGLRPWAL